MRPRHVTVFLVATALVVGATPARADAAWTSPVIISNSTQDASNPQVALDPHGTAVFTWSHFDGTNERVQTRARHADAALSSVQTLSVAGQDAFRPQVGADANGAAVFTWERYDGTYERIQARARSVGGVLSSIQTLSAPGHDAVNPQIVVNARGKAVFGWVGFDGGSWRIQARARSAGGALGPIKTLSGGHAREPQIAIDDVGDAVFTWTRSDGTSASCCDRVQARALSAAGALGPIQNLSAAGQNASAPQVAVDPDGDAVFTFDLNGRVLARARSAAGALGPIQTLSQPGASGPQVGIDDAGKALFSWQRGNIEARTRSAGGALGPIQTIAPGGGPQMAVNGAGKAVFGWFYPDSNNPQVDDVQARRRSATGTLTPIGTLSEEGSSVLPQVAVNGAGSAVVTWLYYDEFRSGHWRAEAAVSP